MRPGYAGRARNRENASSSETSRAPLEDDAPTRPHQHRGADQVIPSARKSDRSEKIALSLAKRWRRVESLARLGMGAADLI